MPSRICCTVMAGVHFFSPPSFRNQKPSGEQRERLMVMPPFPIANLVVGQAGFAFRSLDTFLDPMFRFGDAGELGQLHVRRSIRQIVICFDDTPVVAITITNYDQHFFMAFLASVIASHHAPFDDLDRERPLRAVAHLDRPPLLLRQRGNPSVDALPRPLRPAAVTGIGRLAAVQITDQRVRRNGQQITLAPAVQTPAKRVRTPHLVVPSDPTVRQRVAVFIEHLETRLMSRAIAHVLRHAGLFAPLFVFRPLLGHVQPHVDQGMFFRRDVTHVDGHLIVVDLSQPAAPLTGHADRLLTRFGKGRRIEYQYAVVLAELLADLPNQLLAQWFIIPIGLAHKPLQRHPTLAKTVGDRLDVLVLEVREQPLHKRVCMADLFSSDECLNKRVHEPLQSRHHTVRDLRGYPAFIQQLLLAFFIPRIHALAPSVKQYRRVITGRC